MSLLRPGTERTSRALATITSKPRLSSTKSGGVLCQGEQLRYAFVKAQLQDYPLSMSCAAPGVAVSGYHAWRE